MSGGLIGLAVGAAAGAVWLVAADGGADRLQKVARAPDQGGKDSPGASGLVEDARRRTAVCVLACGIVAWVLGDPVTVVLGLLSGFLLSWWLGRLESPSVAREREQMARDLPLTIDLLAACAEVGLPVQAALGPIAQAVGGPLAVRLDNVSARLALGASPLEEWTRLARDQQLAGLGRTMVRAHRSGAPVAQGLNRLAVDRRRERRTQAQVNARAVGVKVAAPLAACFLPAFMLIGVVPTVVGGFTHLGL